MAEKRERSQSPEVQTINLESTEIITVTQTETIKVNGDTTENEVTEITEIESSEPKKLKQTKKVLITNIPYEVKCQELKDFIIEEVGECDFVRLFETSDGRSKGVGLAEFNSDEAAQKCLEKLYRKSLKGRDIVVKEDKENERDRFGDPIVKRNVDGLVETYDIDPVILKELNVSGHLTNRLFVANIDFKADEKNLRDVFSLAGRVIRIWLHKTEDGKAKGTAIVEMSHPVEAVQAISLLHNQKFYNRELAIRIDKFAQDEDKQRFSLPKIILPKGLKALGKEITVLGVPFSLCQWIMGSSLFGVSGAAAGNTTGYPTTGGSNYYGGGAGGGGDMNSLYGRSPYDDFGYGGTGRDGGANAAQINSLLNSLMGMGAGGATANMSNSQLMSLMNTLCGVGGTGMGALGGGGGNANNPALTNMLLGALGGGGSTPTGGSNGPFPPSPYNNGYGGHHDSSFNSSTYHASSPPHRRSTGGGGAGFSGGSQDNRVVIRNLPSSYKWQDLKDKFREAGDVRYASVNPSKDDTSSSEGIVQFGNSDSARKALRLFDNTRLGGRIINDEFELFEGEFGLLEGEFEL